MTLRHVGLGAWLLLLLGAAARAEEPLVTPGGREPVLQVEAGGPTAAVTALAFGPAGRTLYVGGYDKVVRAWARTGDGAFTLTKSYRVPIGPGADGVVNALALSPDGRWLAVAGAGVMREAAGFRDDGIVMPRAGRLSADMLEDRGTIWLFDTGKVNAARPLRGHR